VEIDTASGTHTFPDARLEDTPGLVASLVGAGESVYGVRVVATTLEETYLQAVDEA
jgi:hypothetical protein